MVLYFDTKVEIIYKSHNTKAINEYFSFKNSYKIENMVFLINCFVDL